MTAVSSHTELRTGLAALPAEIWVVQFSLHQNPQFPYEEDALIIPILQVRKLRLKVLNSLCPKSWHL